MDYIESCEYLAQKEGKRLKIKTIEDINSNIPFFQIDGPTVRVANYKWHDNGPRMTYFANYLMQNVLPEIKSNVDGFYNIELHDSHSYLNNENDYTNCLVWSKHRKNNDVVLIPDIFNLHDFGGQIHEDTIEWKSKNDKIGFWGTTTGNRDPLLNDRINTCLWFHKQDNEHKLSDVYITRLAQIDYNKLIYDVPHIKDVCRKPVPMHEQFTYKFLLDIPGNTCCWDRTPKIMNSNSLMFKMPCDDMCFYYPLLIDNVNYVGVDKHNVLSKQQYFLSNQAEAHHIIKNAQSLRRNVINGYTAKRYMITLLESASDNHQK